MTTGALCAMAAPGLALAGRRCVEVPELGAASAASALALLIGGVLSANKRREA